MSDINIFVTSSLTSSERRVAQHWTFAYFKNRIEQITGIPPVNQRIVVYPSSNSAEYKELKPENSIRGTVGSTVEERENNVQLGEFEFLRPFVRVHVEDDRSESELNEIAKLTFGDRSLSKNPNAETDDEELVNARFVYKDSDYQSRLDSVLKWKEQNKLGRFNPEIAEKQKQSIQENIEKAKLIEVGDRCRIKNTDTEERRGTVRFVGPVKEIALTDAQFVWVGVELDEPLGKNDGSIKGHRYFECRKNYGSFVKPLSVEVGDFPELDLFSDDDEL